MDINIINKTRGVAFILMFIFHIFVFLKLLTHINYLNNPILNFIGIIARNIFILLVGVSLYLSFKNSKNIEEYKKKQLLRSIKIYCIAIYITILTYFIIPEHYIVFGVLHFISISILLLYNFVNNIFALISILIICFILSNYNFTFTLFNTSFLGTYINGILGTTIYKTTMDSFPLIIWIPKIILGIFIGYLIDHFYKKYKNIINKNSKNSINKNSINKNRINKNSINKNKISQQSIQKNENIIDLLGKNTLLLYALHIPFIIIIINIIIFFKKTL